MASRSSTSIAKKARSKAEVDFATWLMMAKLGRFDDLPSTAQAFLNSYRARLEQMSETESKVLAVREEMGGTGAAPEQEARDAITDDNAKKLQKARKPKTPPSAAVASAGPRPRKPIPALLIFAVMVALIAAYKFLAH
jgi:predicted phage gp36 major capsid-like protein